LNPICDVLAESHALGIIHRDIKPGNIFLHQSRGREVVKVVDFGIAKLAGEAAVRQNLTIEGGIIGTPAYMAPERFTGRNYDGRSDVYSLGVMLFQMLTGTLPFTGSGDPMHLAFLHIQKPAPPLRTLRPDLPRALEAVLMQTLDKDYRMRPTAELLARKFQRIVEMDPNAAREIELAAVGSESRTLILPPD
jgi:serine/threonine protein kinase